MVSGLLVYPGSSTSKKAEKAAADRLSVFLRALPKIELHAHLNGSVRDSTLRELCQANNVEVPGVLLKSSHRSLDACFAIFPLIHKLVNTPSTLRRVVRETLEDFEASNVLYLELRTTPRQLNADEESQEKRSPRRAGERARTMSGDELVEATIKQAATGKGPSVGDDDAPWLVPGGIAEYVEIVLAEFRKWEGLDGVEESLGETSSAIEGGEEEKEEDEDEEEEEEEGDGEVNEGEEEGGGRRDASGRLPSRQQAAAPAAATAAAAAAAAPSPPPKLVPRLIISIDRSKGYSAAEEAVTLACELYSSGNPYIVGVEIGGNPTVESFATYRPLLERARNAGLKVAVHCGEVPVPPAGAAAAEKPEIEQVIDFRPDRLGHALFLSDKCLQMLEDDPIPIECCPTSNVMTLELAGGAAGGGEGESLASGLRKHPTLKHWLDIGYPVSISTDDAGVFNTTATNELALVCEAFGMDAWRITGIVWASLDHVFEPSRRVRSRLARDVSVGIKKLLKALEKSEKRKIK